MKNLKHIHRFRISDFELEILRMCKDRKIKTGDFIREAIREKAERDLDLKVVVPF